MKQKSWFKFFLLYVGVIPISLSQLKIVSILTTINRDFHLSLSASAWLMSIFTFSAVFLALSGGSIIDKLGPKKLLLGLFGCLILGNFLGVIAHNYFWLLFSRFIEEILFALIIMVGIILINKWLPETGSGLATGIWGTFSDADSLIAMNIFQPLAQKVGLKAPWIFTLFLALLLLILYAYFIESDSTNI